MDNSKYECSDDNITNCDVYKYIINDYLCYSCAALHTAVNNDVACVHNDNLISECQTYDTNLPITCTTCNADHFLWASSTRCIHNDFAIAGCTDYASTGDPYCIACEPDKSLILKSNDDYYCYISSQIILNCYKYTINFDPLFDRCYECESNYNLKNTNKLCIHNNDLVDECDTYNTDSTCETCINDHFLTQNKCLPNTYYVVNCEVYDAANPFECNSCYDGFELNSSLNTCERVVINCLTYSNTTSECTSCKSVHTCLDPNNLNTPFNCYWCVPDNNYDIKCEDYNTAVDTECTQCQTAYTYLTDLKRCVKTLFIETNCITYFSHANGGKCEYCKLNHFIYQGPSRNYCFHNIFLVKDCETYVLNTNVCTNCLSGYFLTTTNDKQNCVPNVNQFVDCKTYFNKNEKYCKNCNTTTQSAVRIISAPFAKCIDTASITQNCFIYEISTTVCQQCVPGYDLKQDKSCQSSIINCKIPINDSICKECIANHDFANGECIPIEQSDPNCKTWNDDEKQCDECVDGFYLDQGYCFENCSVIENCEACDETDRNECLYCYDGFELHENTCQKHCLLYVENCTECNSDNELCISCDENFVLVDGEECLDICDDRVVECWGCDTKGLVCQEKFCKKYDENCEICSEDDFAKCEECQEEFMLEFNRCFHISDILDYLESEVESYCGWGCVTCPEEDICTQCDTGFKLVDDYCEESSSIIKEVFEEECDGDIFCYNEGQYFNEECNKCQDFCPCTLNLFSNVPEFSCGHTVIFTMDNALVGGNYQIELSEDSRSMKFTFTELSINLEIFKTKAGMIKSSKNCRVDHNQFYTLVNQNFTPSGVTQDALAVTSTISSSGQVGLLSSFVPKWLLAYVIGFTQNMEIYSYVSLLNINAGNVFNFVNSFTNKNISPHGVYTEKSEYNTKFIDQQYSFSQLSSMDLNDLISFGFFFLQVMYIFSVHNFKFFKQKYRSVNKSPNLSYKDNFKIFLHKIKENFLEFKHGLALLFIVKHFPKLAQFFIY